MHHDYPIIAVTDKMLCMADRMLCTMTTRFPGMFGMVAMIEQKKSFLQQ